MKRSADLRLNSYVTLCGGLIFFLLMTGGGTLLQAQGGGNELAGNVCSNATNEEYWNTSSTERLYKTRLDSLEPESEDYFGEAIALEGNVLVVGVNGDDEFGTNAGQVSIYEKEGSTWTLKGQIGPDDIKAEDHFGSQVVLSGDILAVLRVRRSAAENSGIITIFRKEAGLWVQETQIPTSVDARIALSNNHLLIGSASDDITKIYQRIETQKSWKHVGYFQGGTVSGSLRYGAAVAIDGNFLVVGAPKNDHFISTDSMIEIYQMVSPNPYVGDQWVQVATFTNSGDNFGSSVAIAGNTIVVGAPNFGTTGTAYVYEYDGQKWDDGTSLELPSCDVDVVYGTNVTVRDNTIAVSSASGQVPGDIIIFKRTDFAGWYPAYRIDPPWLNLPDGVKPGALRESVSISGDTIATGEGLVSLENRKFVGAVYIYAPVDSIDSVVLTVNKQGNAQQKVVSASSGLDCGTNCDVTVPRGTTVDLQAFSNNEPAFVLEWSEPSCGPGKVCEVTANEDKVVNVIFEAAANGPQPQGVFICTGTPVRHSVLCQDDDLDLTANTAYSLKASCSSPPGSLPKCETICEPGFYKVSNTCVQTYATWKTAHFTPEQQADPNISGETADPDGDYVCNIWEYAAYSDPWAFTYKPDIQKIYFVIVSNTQYFTLWQRKNINATDITYIPAANNVVNGGGDCPVDPPVGTDYKTGTCWYYYWHTGRLQVPIDLDTEAWKFREQHGFLEFSMRFYDNRVRVTGGAQGFSRCQYGGISMPNPFTEIYPTINITKNGEGLVTSSPGLIKCGADSGEVCTDEIRRGTAVTLAAQTAPEYQFNGWGGGCSGTDSTCQLTLTANLDVSATFSPLPFCGNGIVESGEQCDDGAANGQTCHCNQTCDGYKTDVGQKIIPDRVTVNSGEVAKMTFGVPCPVASIKLFMSCPAGLTIGAGLSSNICNSWITLSLPENKETEMQFTTNNTTLGTLKAVPNFYVYYPNNPNYGYGVSGEITVNPKPCGNGNVDPGEECDGSNLNGQTCTSQGFPDDLGALACKSDCQFETKGCSESQMTGKVYDRATNSPISGATITLNPTAYGYGTHDYITTSDANGNYAINEILRFVYSGGQAPKWVEYNLYVSNPRCLDYVSGIIRFENVASVTQDVPLVRQYQYVKVFGRNLLADFDQDGNYTPFLIKGVGYNPSPVGRHPSDWGYPDAADPRPDNILDDEAILQRDFTLLQAMNVNAIRLWKGDNTTAGDGRFPDKMTEKTLTYARQHNLKIIAGFWISPAGQWTCAGTTPKYEPDPVNDFTVPAVRADILNRFAAYVAAFRNRPEILFWAIGNENNLHLNSNNPAQVQAWYSLVNEMAQKVREIEGPDYYHPVALVNGDLGFVGDAAFGASDAQLPYLDIWGSNVYRGNSFGTLFTDYAGKSGKPLWISEYGLDAWKTTNIQNPDQGTEDQFTQALWDGMLWDEVAGNTDKTVGATVMSYSDQWWQPYEWLCGDQSPQCNSTQNHFGQGPKDTNCDGQPDFYPPAPDNFWNQEWWGVVKIAPNPVQYQQDVMTRRPAYWILRQKFNPANNSPIKSYIVSPAQGSVLDSASVSFAWSLGRGVTEYGLAVGSTPGAENIYSASQGTKLSGTVSGIPLAGRDVYVRLKSKINGVWQNSDYRYKTTDKWPPTGSILINNGADVTNNPVVTLNLLASDGDGAIGTMGMMQFSNNNRDWTPLEPYNTTKNNWSLAWPEATTPKGVKTVYVQFKDAAGNSSQIYSDTIILETCGNGICENATNGTANYGESCSACPADCGVCVTISAPGNLRATAHSSSRINLTWTASKYSNNQPGTFSYTIYRSPDGIKFTALPSSASQTFFYDVGLARRTKYWYKLEAFDAAGNRSPMTPAVWATTK